MAAANNGETRENRVLRKKSKKKEIQPFYDSEEEIGWGKLTLKEVKARLNKPQLFKPDIRDRYSTPCMPKSNFVISESGESEMEQINRDDSIPAISEYLTASEEVNGVEESVCTSNYLSVAEPSVANSDKSSIYLSTIDIKRSKNKVDDTCLNFVQKALDASIVYDIENDYQTLIEPTINSSNESTDLVVVISSDEEEFVPHENHTSYDSTEDYNRSTNNFRTDSTRGGSIFYQQQLSPISVPEIDLRQFNDSSDSLLDNTLDKINAILEANLSFNENSEDEEEEENTSSIEPKETEKAINPIKTPPTVKISPTIRPTPIKLTPKNIHTSSVKLTPTITPIKLTPKNIHTSSGKLTPNKSPSTSKSHIPVIKKSPNFRMPELPNKHNFHTKTKTNFKDIVSPVRMYIKYSPKPILKQTVHGTEKPYTRLSPYPRGQDAGHKANKLEEIPNVVYKPSKKQIFALDESTHLPESLDKMIKKSTVIKHERHPLRANFCPNETLDPEAELTKSFLYDSCNLSDIENVSILHKKTALRD